MHTYNEVHTRFSIQILSLFVQEIGRFYISMVHKTVSDETRENLRKIPTYSLVTKSWYDIVLPWLTV